MNKKIIFPLVFLGQLFAAQSFKIIPLGVFGGIDESNLSSYLISEPSKEAYLALDAGTIHTGLKFYLQKKQEKRKSRAIFKRKNQGIFHFASAF